MNPRPHSFRLLIEYDGTHYAGWQRQINSPTVQEALETALETVLGHPVRCHGAGRTDTGVHAQGQVVRIDVASPRIGPESIRRGGNRHLPDDVRILDAVPCAPDFDPRRDARNRWYRYSIINRPSASALDGRHLWHVPQSLDWGAIGEALARLEGDHDFQAYRSIHCTSPRTQLHLVRTAHVDAHPIHHFDFECRSFLQNMIRIMVGLIVEIGQGKHAPEIVTRMFEEKKRTARFRVAPPHGLVLMRVDYPE
jgi:tRNA pseudouridine38-40 synthase